MPRPSAAIAGQTIGESEPAAVACDEYNAGKKTRNAFRSPQPPAQANRKPLIDCAFCYGLSGFQAVLDGCPKFLHLKWLLNEYPPALEDNLRMRVSG